MISLLIVSIPDLVGYQTKIMGFFNPVPLYYAGKTPTIRMLPNPQVGKSLLGHDDLNLMKTTPTLIRRRGQPEERGLF
jgi:hypothetical protein